ncbi:hypothetical protein MTO96_037936 [Rhipicephalus appendiculatus]
MKTSKGWELPLPLRTFMTHLPLSKETITDQGKYIYVARNPWDVCVSLYHMVTNLSMYQYEDATFEQFVDVFVSGNFGYGDYFEHVASAYDLREEPNVLFVTYEEMTKNRREVLLRVAYFLGEHYGRALADDELLLDKILNKSNADYMRNAVVIDFRNLPLPNSKQLSEVRRITCNKCDGGDETKYSLVRTARVGGMEGVLHATFAETYGGENPRCREKNTFHGSVEGHPKRSHELHWKLFLKPV